MDEQSKAITPNSTSLVKQDMNKNISVSNPTGRGGFGDHPEHINKKGRPPKDTSFAELVRDFLSDEDEDITTGEKVDRRVLLLKKLWAMSLDGDANAIKLFLNYGYGMPKFGGVFELVNPEETIKQVLETIKKNAGTTSIQDNSGDVLQKQ